MNMQSAMGNVPDFTRDEITAAREAIEPRWSDRVVETHMVDVALSLDPAQPPLDYPAVFWCVNGCNFVVIKTACSEYRAEFFYSATERFGVGVESFSDIATATLTLLRIQADHDSVKLGNFPGPEYLPEFSPQPPSEHSR